MKRETRETWAKRVERWKDSGLTADEFATEIGVNANTLKFWSSRLNSGTKGDGKRSREGRTVQCRRGRRREAPEFVEVSSHLVMGSASPVEVVVGELVVRVVAGFDDDTLRRVLALLRSAP